MRLEIPITFDEFGWSALEDRARDERLSLDELVAQAVTYYERELDEERQATRVPRFSPPAIGRETRRLTIELVDGTMRGLEREAERQGVALERLIGHAALLYLADVEAGRVAERIYRRSGA